MIILDNLLTLHANSYFYNDIFSVIVDDFDTAKVLLNNETWIDRPFDDLMAERSYGKPLGTLFLRFFYDFF